MGKTEIDFKQAIGMDRKELAKDLAAMLSLSGTPVEVDEAGVNLSALPNKSPWRRGTKSSVYNIVLMPNAVRMKATGQTPLLEYVLKRDGDEGINGENLEERFLRELAILKTTNDDSFSLRGYSFSRGRPVQLFPKCPSVHYAPFNERRMFLLEKIPGKSLHEIASDIQGKANLERDIFPALDPVVLLHDKLPLFLPVENGLVKSLADLTEKDLLNLESWSGKKREEWPKGVVESIVETDKILIGEMLLKSEYATHIQKDGFSWHNYISGLIDAGGVVFGPRPLHLGCLFGDRIVYRVLPENAFFEIAKEYVERGFLAEDDFKINTIQPDIKKRTIGMSRLRHYSGEISEAEKRGMALDLTAAMYVGAGIIGNGSLIRGIRKYGAGQSGKRDERTCTEVEILKHGAVIRQQLEQLTAYNPEARNRITAMTQLSLPGFVDYAHDKTDEFKPVKS